MCPWAFMSYYTSTAVIYFDISHLHAEAQQGILKDEIISVGFDIVLPLFPSDNLPLW